MRAFSQVDVFTSVPFKGNPVAVVLDAAGVSTEEMQAFANWTNLSETTFVLPPTDARADYRVRIFTPDVELPFAGHPTIGTCHAWLEAGGQPESPNEIVQECAAGLIPLRSTPSDSGARLAFAAPPLTRSGPVDEADLVDVCKVLQVSRAEIVHAQWADNGPGWLAVMLADADAVLALAPDFGAVESYDIGIVGPHPIGVAGPSRDGAAGPTQTTGTDAPSLEVRAFFRSGGAPAEDPVTGSLNAALAQWLLPAGVVTSPYVAAQGTALGRAGRVYIEEADGEIWVGGDAVTCVEGSVNV